MQRDAKWLHQLLSLQTRTSYANMYLDVSVDVDADEGQADGYGVHDADTESDQAAAGLKLWLCATSVRMNSVLNLIPNLSWSRV